MMQYRTTAKQMIRQIEQEKIHTWFDLGLFIDRFKENKPVPANPFDENFSQFKKEIGKGGMAFITFFFSIDGASIEIEKYAKICRKNIPGTRIHYIAGEFFPESEKLIHEKTKKFQVDEMQSFNNWSLYKDFFFTRLQRGSDEYNELILKFWDEVKILVAKLGNYIEKNNIKLLYLINTNSNPGNVSLALALVLVSEYMGIPVINNNHDFYWEGGHREVDIKTKGLKKEPRDHFFLNAGTGEFFSQIEMLYPWESRSWVNVNINKQQSNHLVEKNGHNPANVTEIGTAVDLNEYVNISKRSKLDAYYQFEQILSRYKETLVSYSVEDVINNGLVKEEDTRPILIGVKTKPVEHFLTENIIFLQPTRIISRKRIEIGFKLIKKMFTNELFVDRLQKTDDLKVTILVTGPVANGHFAYFEKLIQRFAGLLEVIKPEFSQKIYLAFLFSEFDKESFKNRFKNPVGIPELYNIASLVLLPSKTEGRGLPIIEATACGTPIFCRRYYPENVYKEVIGEDLPEEDRLQIIDFDGKKITTQHVNKIIERVLFPHEYGEEISHNQKVVQKRYSLDSLNQNMVKICKRLHHQLRSNEETESIVRNALHAYKETINYTDENLQELINTRNRHFLPGYGRMNFMIYLKSLIDPSFFRVEEQNFKGMAMAFARKIVKEHRKDFEIPMKRRWRFFNAVDTIFHYREGEISTRHDHSFTYRHRNKNYYPYHDFTIQEITGLIAMLYMEIVRPEVKKPMMENTHFFTDWNLALSQLTSSTVLGIDDRHFLIKKLKANLPIAIFPGDYLKYELEFFALQSVRSRLNLQLHQGLTEDLVAKNCDQIAPVYVFTQKKFMGNWLSKKQVKNYLEQGNEKELRLLYKYNILQLVDTRQKCIGVHFPQLGKKAIETLRNIKDSKGYIITNRDYAATMTDIVGIDRFHIGKVTHPVTANIMGIPVGSGFIQFVPASVRTTLAYPTPVQTSKDFSEALKSDLFLKLADKLGEEKVLEAISKDAEESSSPVLFVLDKLNSTARGKQDVEYQYVSGIYDDRMPWNGVLGKANVSLGKKWQFVAVTTGDKPKTVTKFVAEFNKKHQVKSCVAWNGGYILNPELVGKLGLPETYIGSPLGMLISNGKLTCPPLFNKAALLIYNDGNIDIKRVNAREGLVILLDGKEIAFDKQHYNAEKPGKNDLCYYDLLFEKDKIPGNGRIIVRLAGNEIKEVIQTKAGGDVEVIPVGICLSFPAGKLPPGMENMGTQLDIRVKGYENVKHAIEAGPQLLDSRQFCLDMEEEGWKTQNSIRTQAARLDYTDMRGPKIAVGIDKKGDLHVLTVNGRIRESVGATHGDMATILKKFGIEKAMGFDPGGSSTLVIDGKAMNISPYNKNYEENIYSLPPQPRAVSNAVIGYIEK